MFKTNIQIYGLIIIMSIISGLLVIYNNLKDEKFKNEKILGLMIYIVAGAIIGGKYYTFIMNYNEFKGIFSFNKVGLSSYGAIIGIIIMIIIFSKQFKIKFSKIMYIIMPSIPLIYGIGKFGCFIAGCCYGIEYTGPFKIIYKYSLSAPKGVSLFPIQFLEAIIFILIFIIINSIYKNMKSKEKIIGITFIICGIAKFLLDFLRYTSNYKLLSINQIFSIIFVVIGIFLFFSVRFFKKS